MVAIPPEGNPVAHTTPTIARKTLCQEKARQKEKDKLNGGPVVEEKKKKKSKAKKGEDEPLCAPVSSFRGIKAEHLIKNVREVLDEMDATSRQFAINGCRNAWIVKPSGKSRGRGIKVMRELDEIFRYCASDGFQWVCQKYIERPQLIHGYKFDIRQWDTTCSRIFAKGDKRKEFLERIPEEWRAITVRQLQGVRKDIIRRCPSHIAMGGLSQSRFHNRAGVSQEATGALGAFLPDSDSAEEQVHVKVEKGVFQEGHSVHISGKDCGVATSITWCSDNWTSLRDWQTPLTPEDVTLYDFNYYRLSPSTVPMGILIVGLTASACGSDDVCLQESTRAKGRVSSVADEEVRIVVDRGRFEVGAPITVAGKVVGAPDAFLWNDEVRHCSYVELLTKKPQKPKYFVSHWWGEGVLDFVACLEQHANIHSLGLDAPYWVCAYANDQHELASALGTDPKASSFFRALVGEECRGVLLILNRPRSDDIPAGVPFTRIWCVFEQFVALTSEYSPNLSLDICSWDGKAAQLLVQGLTEAEAKEENFLPGKGYGRKQSREEHFPLVILKQGLQAELQKAEASVPEDRKRILSVISKQDSTKGEPPREHPEYDRVNCALRGLFAIAAWPCAVKSGQVGSLGLPDTLKADVSLKRLEMAFTNLKGMDDATAGLLGKALPPALEELILGFVNTGLGNAGAKNLALALSSCSNLRTVRLDFQNTALGDAGVVELSTCLASLPAVRDLRLGFSETLLADEGITGIAEMLKSSAAFRPLVQHEKDSTTTSSSFQEWEISAKRRLEFDFGKTLFGDKGMALLSDALESLSPLLALNLNVYETGLGDSGLRRMAKALQSQQHLQYLNLVMANTRVSDEGIIHFMTAVSSWLTSLENFMLNLRGCANILGPGIASYADALRSLRSLRSLKLNLRNCSQLQKEQLAPVAEALATNLSLEAASVILLGTITDDAVAAEFIRAFGSLPVLQEVRLGTPGVDIKSIAELHRRM
ncbi:TTLL3, partial [Symbiodinium microadriaticum]